MYHTFCIDTALTGNDCAMKGLIFANLKFLTFDSSIRFSAHTILKDLLEWTDSNNPCYTYIASFYVAAEMRRLVTIPDRGKIQDILVSVGK
jgi:hypothetical protein